MSFIHVPNSIYNFNLSPSELLTYCTLLCLKNKRNHLCCRFQALSNICGLSVATLQRTIKALCKKRLIVLQKQHYYDGKNRANAYTIAPLCSRGFFRIPRFIIENRLAPSAFAVYAYISKCADNKGHAFPSLTKIAKGAGISLNTVISQMQALVDAKLFIKDNYVCETGGFGPNQFYLNDACRSHKHVHVKLRAGKTSVTVCCWHTNRIDIKAQYEALKGVLYICEVSSEDTLKPKEFSTTPLSYHKANCVSRGTANLSKQYLYPSIYSKKKDNMSIS